MALSDDVSLAIRAAPEVYQDPSIALTAAQLGGDVAGNAQATAHALNTQATASALEEVGQRNGGKGLLGATFSWLGGGIKGAMDAVGHGVQTVGYVASLPIEQVKQQYRYLRDVEARHGMGAMLGQGVIMGAGGLAGFALAGPKGAMLGTEAAGWAMESFDIGYKDSWDRVAKGEEYRDPHGGQLISPGRDTARSLDALTRHVGVRVTQKEGFDLYDAVSGIVDGLFNVVADPLAQAGGYRKELLGAKATEQGLVGGG